MCRLCNNRKKVDTGLCGHPVPPRRRQNSFFARSFGSSGRRGHRHGAVDVVVAAKIEMRVPAGRRSSPVFAHQR